MSGSSRNSRPPEYWQPGQDYWIYLPASLSDFVPARGPPYFSGRTRDPWLLVEERFVEPNHGLASFPPATPIDDTHPGARQATSYSPPTYYQPWNNLASVEEESRLSPEEQKQAVNKLRKQFYSPHIYNIIRRLGTKSTSGSPGASSQDDEGKRCPVCLEDFETKQFVTITPCNHMFHEECIVPWVKSQGKCPVCRFVIAEKIPSQQTRTNVASRRGGVGRNLLF